MYTGVVLDAESVAKLMGRFESSIPSDWSVKAHHMTVNMGSAASGPAAGIVGQEVELRVVSVALDALVMAVGVECVVPSANTNKHVTLAVNERAGGKAKMSNDLGIWEPVPQLVLRGTVREI